MLTLSVINQKGGCGKTVTAANLAFVVAASGRSVLLIDLDPQASLGVSLGIEDGSNLFEDQTPRLIPTAFPGVTLIPGHMTLMNAEHRLYRRQEWGRLRGLLQALKGPDVVIIDSPPSLSGATLNAIVAADLILIPATLDADVIDKAGTSLGIIRDLQAGNWDVTSRVHGVITRFRDTPAQRQGLVFAEEHYPIWLTTRIRESQLYTRASFQHRPASALGNSRSAPLADHTNLAHELGLLNAK